MKVKVCVTGSLLQCPAGLGPLTLVLRTPQLYWVAMKLPSSPLPSGPHHSCFLHPAKLGLFWIGRELQFGAVGCPRGEAH